MKTPAGCLTLLENTTDWITSGRDVQYIIQSDKKGEVTVVFDQSNSLEDWTNNLKFWKTPYKNMEVKFKVHTGFLKCWHSVRDEIMDAIETLNPSAITITGHSYGGAMAILCMEDCWYRFIKCREESEDEEVQATSLRDKIQCITFGAPRVIGKWRFKKVQERWLNSRLFTNGADIVTCLPPAIFGYIHVVKQTHVGDFRRIWRFFLGKKYHDLPGYRESIEKFK